MTEETKEIPIEEQINSVLGPYKDWAVMKADLMERYTEFKTWRDSNSEAFMDLTGERTSRNKEPQILRDLIFGFSIMKRSLKNLGLDEIIREGEQIEDEISGWSKSYDPTLSNTEYEQKFWDMAKRINDLFNKILESI